MNIFISFEVKIFGDYIGHTLTQGTEKTVHLTATILSTILKTMGRQYPNFYLIQDVDKRDARMKFKQNPLRMNSLLHIYAHFNILKKKDLGKNCEKRLNYSKWVISPFSTCNLYFKIFQ